MAGGADDARHQDGGERAVEALRIAEGDEGAEVAVGERQRLVGVLRVFRRDNIMV